MDISKVEVNAVADVVAEANTELTVELSDLQLALIGGGVGEVVFA